VKLFQPRAACVLLSLLIVLWPGRPNAGDDGEADASYEGAIETRNTFAIYKAGWDGAMTRARKIIYQGEEWRLMDPEDMA